MQSGTRTGASLPVFELPHTQGPRGRCREAPGFSIHFLIHGWICGIWMEDGMGWDALVWDWWIGHHVYGLAVKIPTHGSNTPKGAHSERG